MLRNVAFHFCFFMARVGPTAYSRAQWSALMWRTMGYKATVLK